MKIDFHSEQKKISTIQPEKIFNHAHDNQKTPKILTNNMGEPGISPAWNTWNLGTNSPENNSSVIINKRKTIKSKKFKGSDWILYEGYEGNQQRVLNQLNATSKS